jgi:hypothetical protein
MRISRISLVLGLLAAPAVASAQVDVPPVSHAPMGMESVRRGVQGPAGMLHGRLLLHVEMTEGLAGEPISLAPDLYFAFSDTFQIGIVHNLPMGWLTRPGAGLCLTGTDGRCPRVYNNVGIDALIGLVFGHDFHFSLHTGLYALRLSEPRWLMLTLGGAGKIHFSDTFALFFDPQFGVALTERERGNINYFFMPLELQFQISDTSVFKLMSGLTGPLSNFGDTYQAPLGVGVVFNVNEHIDLGARFSFDNLLGNVPAGIDRTDVRSLSFLLHFRF